LTNTLDKFIQDTFQESKSGEMLKKSTQRPSQNSTYSLQDSLVRLSVLLESGSDLKSQEANYFLKLLGLSSKHDLDYCYLKTLKDSFLTIQGELSQSFSQRWGNWGMMSNGRCSIANTSFHKTGSVSSLSDILERIELGYKCYNRYKHYNTYNEVGGESCND